MISHVAVLVSDLARAETFYAGLLGLPVIRRWDDEEGRPRSIWLDVGGGAFLAVELAAAGGPGRDNLTPGWHCLALAIAASEREAWRSRVAVERETRYTLYVRDPDGNLVGLSHWPEPCAPPDPT
jgi:glyoxylase I family protein